MLRSTFGPSTLGGETINFLQQNPNGFVVAVKDDDAWLLYCCEDSSDGGVQLRAGGTIKTGEHCLVVAVGNCTIHRSQKEQVTT